MKTVIKILAKIMVMPIWKLVVESSIRVKWLYNKLDASTCGYRNYAEYLQHQLEVNHRLAKHQKMLNINNITACGKKFVK